MTEAETAAFFADTPDLPRMSAPRDSHLDIPDDLARREASRCGHCDCSKLHDCRLRQVALRYDANANKFKGARRDFHRQNTHPLVVYESGKCILCGLCVAIASRAAEPLGLTFIGRGFHVDIGVPLNENLSASLERVARECAAACPTGALAMRHDAAAECSQPADGPVKLSLPQLRHYAAVPATT
jgi:predicted molibdopterin-dependent oxidoreductase YjgC